MWVELRCKFVFQKFWFVSRPLKSLCCSSNSSWIVEIPGVKNFVVLGFHPLQSRGGFDPHNLPLGLISYDTKLDYCVAVLTRVQLLI